MRWRSSTRVRPVSSQSCCVPLEDPPVLGVDHQDGLAGALLEDAVHGVPPDDLAAEALRLQPGGHEPPQRVERAQRGGALPARQHQPQHLHLLRTLREPEEDRLQRGRAGFDPEPDQVGQRALAGGQDARRRRHDRGAAPRGRGPAPAPAAPHLGADAAGAEGQRRPPPGSRPPAPRRDGAAMKQLSQRRPGDPGRVAGDFSEGPLHPGGDWRRPGRTPGRSSHARPHSLTRESAGPYMAAGRSSSGVPPGRGSGTGERRRIGHGDGDAGGRGRGADGERDRPGGCAGGDGGGPGGRDARAGLPGGGEAGGRPGMLVEKGKIAAPRARRGRSPGSTPRLAWRTAAGPTSRWRRSSRTWP